MLRNAPLED